MTTSPHSAPAIGAELRRLRKSLGLTLVELGERTSLPVATVAAYEAGRVVPPADRLLRLVHALRKAKEPFQLDRVARAVAAEPQLRAA